MKPTLFILAAGMGSRYGGLKQLDGLGPNGETIMDYSVYDALRAGFGKIVLSSARTLRKISARSSSPNTRTRCPAKSASRLSTNCPKATAARREDRNLGVRITPF